MKFRSMIAMLVLSAGLAPTAEAQMMDQFDFLFESVSASSCQTRLSADRSKVTWIDDSWHLAAGELGPVEFECPVFTPWIDEDTGIRTPNTFYLTYTDTSGNTASVTSVKAEWLYRGPTAAVATLVATLTSDSVADVGSNTIGIAVPAMVDAQYFVAVTLKRANTGFTVSFKGLSFSH